MKCRIICLIENGEWRMENGEYSQFSTLNSQLKFIFSILTKVGDRL